MTKKYQIYHHQIRFSKLKMHQNPFSTGALPRTPPGELRPTTLPQYPLVGWGGGYPLLIPLPARRLRRLELGAYGASVLRPPSTQNPGYASGLTRQCQISNFHDTIIKH